jgi:hypothetical protein
MAMSANQRICPDCGNPYPGDDEAPTLPAGTPPAPSRRPPESGGNGGAAGGAGGGPLGPLAPYKTVLVLVGVLVLIVAVGYLLFQFAMSFFGASRPDPSTLATSTTAPPVVAPPTLSAVGSPAAGASPSPDTGPGTLISPSASPSPSAAPGARMKVVNTEGQGANMRQRPSTTAPVLKTLPEGTVVEAIGEPTNAEGRAWRNVRDPGGATGWVAAELLAPE